MVSNFSLIRHIPTMINYIRFMLAYTISTPVALTQEQYENYSFCVQTFDSVSLSLSALGVDYNLSWSVTNGHIKDVHGHNITQSCSGVDCLSVQLFTAFKELYCLIKNVYHSKKPLKNDSIGQEFLLIDEFINNYKNKFN
jgi:hypothetical protein